MLEPNIKTQIYKTDTLPLKIYIPPKIHRNNVPLGPIISSIDSPTYNISKHWSNLLQLLIGQTSTFVKDSTEFVEKMDNSTVDINDLLVRFDIVSLFTMMTIEETFDQLNEIFLENLTKLFRCDGFRL